VESLCPNGREWIDVDGDGWVATVGTDWLAPISWVVDQAPNVVDVSFRVTLPPIPIWVPEGEQLNVQLCAYAPLNPWGFEEFV